MSKIFDLPDRDERSFEEQMKDLGVPVEKINNNKTAKTISDWIVPGKTGETNSFDLSLRRTCLAISPKWMKKIAGGKDKINLAFKVVEFEGKKALFFCERTPGFSFKQTKHEGQAWRISLSPGFKQCLEKHDVVRGRYSISIVANGYLAVCDE